MPSSLAGCGGQGAGPRTRIHGVDRSFASALICNLEGATDPVTVARRARAGAHRPRGRCPRRGLRWGSRRWVGSSLLPGGLLAIGVLAVHELRYRLAFGEAAGAMLAAHGHGYLAVVTPLVAALLALGAGTAIARWACGGATGRRPRRLSVLWPLLSATLVAGFSAQEIVEGALAGGHPAGWAALFAGDGWVAFALAPLVALPLALFVPFTRMSAGCAGERAPPDATFGACADLDRSAVRRGPRAWAIAFGRPGASSSRRLTTPRRHPPQTDDLDREDPRDQTADHRAGPGRHRGPRARLRGATTRRGAARPDRRPCPRAAVSRRVGHPRARPGLGSGARRRPSPPRPSCARTTRRTSRWPRARPCASACGRPRATRSMSTATT